ncbi:hypothetical protein K488DRAFT_85537 [Vararia minispora EC-137]|uniref:Uncharacterized protein n=1 Tax=Vararia minispora EC-137 TaxID=1314806 RepID=A0ACB8QMT4_9AGAM|nr:hypothetical protein K488DRAFT_85537 [Vararia minispora EC-137]
MSSSLSVPLSSSLSSSTSDSATQLPSSSSSSTTTQGSSIAVVACSRARVPRCRSAKGPIVPAALFLIFPVHSSIMSLTAFPFSSRLVQSWNDVKHSDQLSTSYLLIPAFHIINIPIIFIHARFLFTAFIISWVIVDSGVQFKPQFDSGIHLVDLAAVVVESELIRVLDADHVLDTVRPAPLRSTTNSAGEVSTVILTSTALIPAQSGAVQRSSSSNTGAIVGGVVGGVGGALLLAVLAFLLFRWRRNREDDFDGNFDPDRVVRHSGPLDMAADDALHPDPFPYTGPSGGGGGPSSGGAPSMAYADPSQSVLGPIAGAGAGAAAYDAYNRAQSPPSAYSGAVSDGSHYPPSTLPSQPGSYYYGDPRAAPGAHVSPGPSMGVPPSSSSEASWGPRSAESAGHAQMPVPVQMPMPGVAAWAQQQPRSAKEREARGFAVANADDNASGVVQHTDGGRVEDDSASPREIPPSYDSIPSDQR